ncbi:MAG: GAF domain-containing sensor histidine kinase [Candidatus Magnetoovum sp. WYHC-5]|nr:GAF domain-containing sensor histidine kinase [Candidatus Magnetoovum sp. WYHC-5]
MQNLDGDRADDFLLLDFLQNVLKYTTNPINAEESLCKEIRELTGALLVAIIRHNDSGNIHTINFHPSKRKEILFNDSFLYFVSSVIKLNKTFQCERAYIESFCADLLLIQNISNVLLLPLWAGDVRIGSLLILNFTLTDNTSSIIHTMEMIAQVIGLILLNLSYNFKIRQLVSEKTRELDLQSAMAEVSEALLSKEKNMFDIARIIHRQALKLTDSLHGYVAEIDQNVNSYVIETSICNIHLSQNTITFPKNPNGEYNALWGYALNTKKGFYTNAPQTHPSYKGCAPEGHMPITRFLSVPALIADKLIGQIALANANRDYTDDDLNIISRLASIYAIAVERKRMEEEIRQMNKNLQKSVQEEVNKYRLQEQMLIQQSKMASMGEMIALIAHQWRQPLNAIALQANDLKDAYDYGELDQAYLNESVDTINQQIVFMAKTIDDFRNFLRPSKEKVIFSVKHTIEALLDMFKGVYKKNDIYIAINASDKISNFNVMGYPSEFKQVILNIINNSRDAIINRRAIKGRGFIGYVELFISEMDSRVVTSIKDNGGGIPDDVINKVFEPYFSTKLNDKGTGIGLYMSKTIIENNMDGKLTVKNIDDGVEFTIIMKKV